ncbi:TIR domain-containing protein [Cryptosporangium arvum]|uniref:TIR domain-containing protein n=1 Tax=Cryptosporangium arvum TaxID=80871 RepID=UPI0004B620E4|nr:TIR domain-containing protein [Cryptosporangium arvum]
MSFTADDASWAEWIALALRDAGYDVIFQPWSMTPGTQWPSKVDEAVEADHTVAVVSAAYLDSAVCRAEWTAAWARDPVGDTRRLIPVRIEDCALQGVLPQVVYSDLFDVGRTPVGRDRLLTAVAGGPVVAAAAPARRRDHLDRQRVRIRQYPPAGGLLGRESELAELSAFCRGEAPYAWWVGEAWAGKSALMSEFALKPPDDLEVVSFFVDSRRLAEATGAEFVESIGAQLSDLVTAGQADAAIGSFGESWLMLLEQAAERVRRSGRRLLVLVDGLDEDRRSAGVPSIATLLPIRLPDGVRILVTSRPEPGLPADVRDDHPLRACTPRRLAQLGYAADDERRAGQELDVLLDTEQVHGGLLGLITAAGGGLRPEDLAELAGLTLRDVERMLGSFFGRTIVRVAAEKGGAADGGGSTLTFAHAALQATAEARLADRLPGHRREIIAWADAYAARRWPAGTTPPYLLFDYPGMLRAAGEQDALTRLATDAFRHDRLYAETSSDAAALAETREAHDLICATGRPAVADLTVLAGVSAARDRLLHRNRYLPVTLPALWLALGDRPRAAALFRSITDLDRSKEAQRALSRADPSPEPSATPLNEYQWIQAVARAIGSAVDPARLVAEVLRMAGRITDPYQCADALTMVVKSLAEADRATLAEPVIEEAAARAAQLVESKHVQAITALARAVAQAGQVARAVTLARTVTDQREQGRVLLALGLALIDLGVYSGAESVGVSLEDGPQRGRVLAALAAALAESGELHRAEQVAHRIGHPYWETAAWLDIAEIARDKGDRSTMDKLMRRAGRSERQIPPDDATSQDNIRFRRASALARQGDAVGACKLLGRISTPRVRINALPRVSKLVAESQQPAGAISVLRLYGSSPGYAKARVRATTEVVALLARRDATLARELAGSIRPPERRVEALVSLAQVHLANGDLGAADAVVAEIPTAEGRASGYAAMLRLADETDETRMRTLAERAVRCCASIGSRERRSATLVLVAGAALDRGLMDVARELAGRAEEVVRHDDEAEAVLDACAAARAYQEPDGPAGLLLAEAQRRLDLIGDRERWLVAALEVAKTAQDVGDQDVAWRAARAVAAPYRPGQCVADLAVALADAGCLDLAEQHALAVRPARQQADALAAVAGAAASAGQDAHCGTVLDKARRAADRVDDLADRVEALGTLVAVAKAAGRRQQAWSLTRRAEGVIGTISHPGQRAAARARLAAATAPNAPRRTDRTTTEAEADLLLDPGERSAALRDLACAAAGAGDEKRAQALAERAAALIPPSIGTEWSMGVQTGLARIALTIGDHDLAHAVIWAMRDGAERTRLQLTLAEALADDDDFAAGGRAPTRTAVPGERSSTGTAAENPALAAVAEARRLVAEDGLAAAEQWAATLTDPRSRCVAFTTLVEAAGERPSETRRFGEEAARWADRIEDSKLKARALAALARTVARTGDRVSARELTERAKAVRVARQTEVLVELVKTMAIIGDYQRCRQLALLMPQPQSSRALVAAAGERSDHEGLLPIVCLALRNGSWRTVVEDPQALPADVVTAIAAAARNRLLGG